MKTQEMMRLSLGRGLSDRANLDLNFNDQQIRTNRKYGEVSIHKVFLLTALAILALASNATAIVFDLSPTNGLMAYDATFGAGQGVVVSTTQVITDMGFYLDQPNGGDLKFMIWDATNSTLLFSSTLNPGPSFSPSWVYSLPFNFTVNAGQTYWFGIINDHSFMQLGTIAPPINYSDNGLTAITGGSSNYVSYASPAFSGYTSGMQVGLQLDGTPVPEPGSLMLLGSGVFGLARMACGKRKA
jgi:hypothetical protein